MGGFRRPGARDPSFLGMWVLPQFPLLLLFLSPQFRRAWWKGFRAHADLRPPGSLPWDHLSFDLLWLRLCLRACDL